MNTKNVFISGMMMSSVLLSGCADFSLNKQLVKTAANVAIHAAFSHRVQVKQIMVSLAEKFLTFELNDR